MRFSILTKWWIFAGLFAVIAVSGGACAAEEWPFPYSKYPEDQNYCRSLFGTNSEEPDSDQDKPKRDGNERAKSRLNSSSDTEDSKKYTTDFGNTNDYDFWEPEKQRDKASGQYR